MATLTLKSEGTQVDVRTTDSYVNVTTLSHSLGKTWDDYRTIQNNQAYATALAKSVQKQEITTVSTATGYLIYVGKEHTWAHPDLG